MSVRQVLAAVGAVVALLLMVAALWAWGRAGVLALGTTRPDVARWAVRSAAVAAAAVSQVLLLTFVAGAMLRHRSVGRDLLRLFAGTVAGVAAVSAVALGLAGR